MVFVVLALYDLLFCKQLWKPARHGKRLHSSRRRNVSWHVLDLVLLAPSHKLVFHPKGLRMAGIQSVQATIIAFIKDISRKISLAGWLWSVKLGTMPMRSSLVSKGSTLGSLKLWILQFLLGFGFTIIDIPWDNEDSQHRPSSFTHAWAYFFDRQKSHYELNQWEAFSTDDEMDALDDLWLIRIAFANFWFLISFAWGRACQKWFKDL